MSEGEGGGEREIVRKKDRKTKREGEKEAWAERGREKDHSQFLTFHSFFQSRHHFTSTQSKTQCRIFLKIIEDLLPSIHTQIT